MWRSRKLGRFLVGVLVLFGLLTAPWPGWNRGYSQWLGVVGTATFSLVPARWSVSFAAQPRTAARPLDLRVTVGNREQLGPDGRTPGITLELDARGIGWVPTATFLALVLATPVAWPRRLFALVTGLALMHLFLALTLAVHVLHLTAKQEMLHLLSVSPKMQMVLGAVDYTLVIQMGTGFAMALVLWVVTLFRREDWALLSPEA